MTSFEDKQTIVIKQLRADRDRLLTAIEDIKAEIEETIESYVCDKEENTMKAQGMLNAMRMTFDIIDKHISGKENDD